MFLESFKANIAGFSQVFILGLIGFMLIRLKVLSKDGMDALSRLTIWVVLPLFILTRLIKDFSFEAYPHWWIFPLISLIVTLLGFFVGGAASFFVKGGAESKLQFLGLVSFQNSGYLPLVLVASLLQGAQRETMFIYIFLFLLGFNLIMFSFGVYLLTLTEKKRFEWITLLNPPVAVTLLGLMLIFFGLQKFIPDMIIKPLASLGECTLPLSVLIVGANIASIKLSSIDIRANVLMIAGKLILMPLVGLLFCMLSGVSQLLGLLIVLELAMPPATNLSVIISSYKRKDLLISQGVFFGNLASLITIPLFLSLYFAKVMIK